MSRIACSSTGSSENLALCTDTASGCFDLTVNDDAVLNGLDPADYIITYHLTLADATSGISPLTNPASYCTTPGTQTIYLRLAEIAGGFEVFDFSISVHTAFGNALILNQMVQCDDDGDGQVIFNLVEGAYLIDDLPLTFYPSMADALAQTNEITNPTPYSHTAGVNTDTTIIVRQEITGD